MKICFFYHQVFRHGGIQRVLATLVNEMSKNHECWIVCTQPIENLPNPYSLNTDRINIVYLNIDSVDDNKKISINIRRRFYGTGAWFLHKKSKNKVIKFINENKFDCVIGCMLEYNILLSSIKDHINCRIIGWEHNSFYSYVNYRGGSRIGKLVHSIRKIINYQFIKKHLKKLDDFVVLTKEEQKIYTKLFDINALIISNPLCIAVKGNNRSMLFSKIILTIGRLEEIKGADMLGDIISGFCAKNEDWKFKIIGEGPIKSHIMKRLVNENIRDRVVFENFKENILEEYISGSIYLCPSRFESFGLTGLEALAHGLPVVSFNTSGPKEIVEGYNCGEIIANYQIDEMIEGLIDLVSKDEKREIYSLNAIERAKSFEIQTVIEKWNSLLSKSY